MIPSLTSIRLAAQAPLELQLAGQNHVNLLHIKQRILDHRTNGLGPRDVDVRSTKSAGTSHNFELVSGPKIFVSQSHEKKKHARIFTNVPSPSLLEPTTCR
jgi:hypothetical protein